MREILFRGRRTDNHQWVYGYLVFYSYENPNPYIIARRKYRIEHKSIGQFTGLLDKNGKRIFEGDILEHHVQGNILVNRGVVNWDARNGRWAHQLNTMNPCFYMHNPDAFEVIGNRFDNPELLEVTPDE